MLVFKLFLLFVFLISGGAFVHPAIKRYLRTHTVVGRTAIAITIIGGVYLFVDLFTDVDEAVKWGYRRITIGPFIDRAYSIGECDRSLTIQCVRYGGVFGDPSALGKIRECPRPQLLPSSAARLRWTSLWITNVYSYAPGGGGPGGGLIDHVLKVGGWGDWYFTLIKFDLPTRNVPMAFAGVLLFAQDGEHETIPLFVDRIIEPWKWDLTQHIWWKDRPGGFPVITDALPAPQKKHWYIIEITRLYDQWRTGVVGNFGFQIRPATNYGSFVEFSNNLAADKTKIPYLLLCPKS